jgi:hypothetical protein
MHSACHALSRERKARSGFFTGLFKLVEVNPALDGLRRAITEFLLQLGDPVPELGFSGVALALPGPGEIPP